jgi:hypothetical protein
VWHTKGISEKLMDFYPTEETWFHGIFVVAAAARDNDDNDDDDNAAGIIITADPHGRAV